ncbi:acyltransferase family protein [Methylocaldum szegediense]|uniref:Acyl_transf_3 domain-containing protein n=1 Tax=Methylocaldum szegediense TaxID=73780 RepID=A0ABN8X7S2_9GAMM|nr:acyltransferase [Methylocaldum szegediense]CAI8926099.1 Acyl_transf_3 domain-containing protein [Methylocaldum szegediense]
MNAKPQGRVYSIQSPTTHFTNGVVAARRLGSRSAVSPFATASPRLEWLDVAKGFGIVLVVFGHGLGGLIDAGLDQPGSGFRDVLLLIYLFHMPLFFILSGVLVQTRIETNAGRFRRSLLVNIVYPYFLWSTIQFTAIYLAGNLVNAPADAFWPTVLSLPYRTVSQFWFLYALFLMHCASLLLLQRVGPTLFLLIMLMLKSVVLIVPLDAPWRQAASMAPYYGTGVLLGSQGITKALIDQPKWVKLALLPIISALLLALTYFAIIGEMAPATFYKARTAEILGQSWTFTALAAALATSAAVIALSSTMPAWFAGALAYLGRMSLAIFILHVLFVAGTRIVLTNVFNFTNPYLVLLAIVTIGLLGPLIVVRTLEFLRLAKPLGLT